MRDQQPTNQTRRAVIGALAGGAAAVASAVATGIVDAAPMPPAAVLPPDPMFALIDAHRLARVRYEAARDAVDVLYQSLPSDVARDARVLVGNVGHPTYFYSHGEINASVRQSFNGAKMRNLDPQMHWKSWIREKHTRLQDDIVRQRELHAETGLTVARAAEQEADDAEEAAINALCTVPATTVGGMLAMVRYMLAYERKYLDSDIDDVVDPGYRIVGAVERSLSSMVG